MWCALLVAGCGRLGFDPSVADPAGSDASAVGDGGTGGDRPFFADAAVTGASCGGLLVPDDGSEQILRVSLDKEITVAVAATAIAETIGDGYDFNEAGVVLLDDSSVVFGDPESGSLLMAAPDGGVSFLIPESEIAALTGTKGDPNGLALAPDGMLYFLDDNADAVVAVDPETREVSIVVSREGFPSQVEFDAAIGALDAETLIVGSEKVQGTSKLFLVPLSTSEPVETHSGSPLETMAGFVAPLSDGSALITDPGVTVGGTVLRRTSDGAVTVFIEEAAITEAAGKQASVVGITTDDAGNIYLVEDTSEAILRFSSDGSDGTIWLDGASIAAATGVPADLDGAIAFEGPCP